MLNNFRGVLGAGVALLLSPFALAAEVPGLAVDGLNFKSGSTTRIGWNTSASATFYGLYRGRILPEGTFFRRDNHRCLATEIGRNWADDPDLPEPGTAFYYLANGLRPGMTPTTMDWGPLGVGGVVRPEGYLPCGRQIYVDPAATGAGDGSSWMDAYTSLTAAVSHPSPEDRSLEMWLTGETREYLAAPRGQLVFYGGFQGGENYAWDRSPQSLLFDWKGPVGALGDLVRDPGFWLCEEVYFVFDGISFDGGDRGIFFLVSGLKIEVLRSAFQNQSRYAIQLNTPSDYACGVEAFVDQSELRGRQSTGVFRLSIEGGDHGDLRVHRSQLSGGGPDLLGVEVKDGLFGSNARVELMGNDLDGGDPALDLTTRSWDGNTASIDLALASNVIHNTFGDGIEMTSEGGTGQARIEGLIVGNTITDTRGSGLKCTLTASGGTASCTPDLTSNIIAFCNNYAVEEPADAAPGLSGDSRMVGNDLFGNYGMLLDEGVLALNLITDINALPGNWGNISIPPLFVNPVANNYHLQPSSGLIDACVVPPPRWAVIDIDSTPRTNEGNGVVPMDGDIGADEVSP